MSEFSKQKQALYWLCICYLVGESNEFEEKNCVDDLALKLKVFGFMF